MKAAGGCRALALTRCYNSSGWLVDQNFVFNLLASVVKPGS
jgi:hypothetical protein